MKVVAIIAEKTTAPTNEPPDPPLFNAELKDYPIDFNEPKHSDLLELFKDHGISFPQHFTVHGIPDGLTIIDEDDKQAYFMAKVEEKLKVYKLSEIPTHDLPIVVLQLKDKPQQWFPIWIGIPEATAISMGIRGDKPSRPMTHDLLLNLLQAANATIQQIIVSDFQENTFIGKMIIDFNGTVKEIDCRPSDAIAIAVRTKLPILIAKKLADAELLWRPQEELQEFLKRKEEFHSISAYRKKIGVKV